MNYIPIDSTPIIDFSDSGLLYTLPLEEDNDRGDAVCLLRLCNDQKINVDLRNAFKRESLSPMDYCFYITSFFPNGGHATDKPYSKMRQGRGSYLMRKIILDAEDLDARVVACVSSQPEMHQFLLKNQFKPTKLNKFAMYLLLK